MPSALCHFPSVEDGKSCCIRLSGHAVNECRVGTLSCWKLRPHVTRHASPRPKLNAGAIDRLRRKGKGPLGDESPPLGLPPTSYLPSIELLLYYVQNPFARPDPRLSAHDFSACGVPKRGKQGQPPSISPRGCSTSPKPTLLAPPLKIGGKCSTLPKWSLSRVRLCGDAVLNEGGASLQYLVQDGEGSGLRLL